MTVSRADVVQKAVELYGAQDAQKVLCVIDQYGTEPHEREIDRVKLAILEVGDGHFHRLPYFVMCAKIDYRDLLLGQKLGATSDEEEAKWLASANKRIEIWKAQREKR